jgi:hypothetical protein
VFQLPQRPGLDLPNSLAAASALVASTASLSLAADLSPQEAQKIGVDAGHGTSEGWFG